MNCIKLNLSTICFLLFGIVNAQPIKPGFKQIVYAQYFAQIRNSRDTGVLIQRYLVINERGQTHYTISLGDAAAYDTTYQLPDTLIAKLNKVFKKNRKLESNVITNKLPNGTVYRGWLNFISFIDLEGGVHSFIDVKPYMSNEFNALVDAVTHKASVMTYKNMGINNKVLIRQILNCQRSCKYCPPIDDITKNPPTLAHLEIAADPVPLIDLKDVALYNGKYVKIIAIVSAHRVLDTLEALAMGGTYPNQALTVVLYGKALNAFKTNDIDGKTIWIYGVIWANKENKDPQMFIRDPQLISIIPKH